MDLTKLKAKAIEVKNQVVEKAKVVKDTTVQFFEDHPASFIPVLSAAGMLFSGIMAAANQKSDNYKEKCLVEDDVTGQDFRTTHPMTNNEILELGSRMIDGQTKGDALCEMGLLAKEKRR